MATPPGWYSDATHRRPGLAWVSRDAFNELIAGAVAAQNALGALLLATLDVAHDLVELDLVDLESRMNVVVSNWKGCLSRTLSGLERAFVQDDLERMFQT